LPRGSEIAVDGRVLLFTLAISALAGIAFGLGPALQMAGQDCNAALRAEGRGATPGRQRHAALQILIAAQVALSMVLLAGAGLLVRNFAQIRGAGPGFDGSHLLTMSLTLPPSRYASGAAMVSFFDEVLQQVRGLPGVRAAVAASALPANPARFTPALPEGQPPIPLAQRPLFIIQTATPGYVETLRVPLRRGRDFTGHDGAKDARVAMVNEALARRYWPGTDPIGKHIWLGRQTSPVEVVGVLGDVRNVSLTADSQPEIYLPFAQLPWGFMNLIVRTEGDPLALAAAVRGRVLAVDREQPVTRVRSMEDVMDVAAAQPRFTTWLLGALAGAALTLALVGIYGVVARAAAERTAEMGIRLALGANPADLLWLALRQGLTMTLAGIGAGLAASLVLTRLLSSQLYRVSATDPAVLALSAALLAGAAALASYVPARRAMRTDPIQALRAE
jgi:putative ABC transport system permease protein